MKPEVQQGKCEPVAQQFGANTHDRKSDAVKMTKPVSLDGVIGYLASCSGVSLAIAARLDRYIDTFPGSLVTSLLWPK